MRWKDREGSQNIEDRRGKSGNRRGPGLPRMGGIAGLITLVIVAVVFFTSDDPGQVKEVIKNLSPVESGTTGGPVETGNAKEDELAQFASVVLADCERVWSRIFRDELRKTYREPVLVLFSESTSSACGYASAATGPFYCPGDEKAYLDLSFFNTLKKRFKAPGDFAMAYVIAHEVGHHVQNLLGTSEMVHDKKKRVSKEEYNRLSVRLELQADFYAGLWAHHADKMDDILEAGDLDEALNAARAIGDDNIQKRSKGYVVPESFTHGTSAQRRRWFKKGFDTGDFRQGDTFAAENL